MSHVRHVNRGAVTDINMPAMLSLSVHHYLIQNNININISIINNMSSRSKSKNANKQNKQGKVSHTKSRL